jgi:hypothetical protein
LPQDWGQSKHEEASEVALFEKLVEEGMYRSEKIPGQPHFFEKHAEEGVYRSDKILRQLYDMVERVACYNLSFNPIIMRLFGFYAEVLQKA